jgi:hypothetical protein
MWYKYVLEKVQWPRRRRRGRGRERERRRKSFNSGIYLILKTLQDCKTAILQD